MKQSNHLAMCQRGDAAIVRQADHSLKLRQSPIRNIAKLPNRFAFTMTELMVAIAVLVVVIIATSQIFGTASRIVALGLATSSVMTEAATIERLMREDIAKLTSEGFFVIRSVQVRNDVNIAAGGPLLNPNLPEPAVLRADQLVFFANGVESISGFRPAAGSNSRGQSTAARIYWGPAFQLRDGRRATLPATGNFPIKSHDPAHVSTVNTVLGFSTLTPWHYGNVTMVRTNIDVSGADTAVFRPDAPGAGESPINGNQPDARQMLLARQAVALMDDDGSDPNSGSKTVYLNEMMTARSIFLATSAANPLPFGFSREIRNGRIDAAATQLNDVRRFVTSVNYTGNFFGRPWENPASWSSTAGGVGSPDQRRVISSAVYYPRAERRAPGPSRVDQALCEHVVGSGCSSFIIEWTYDDGVGDAVSSDGQFFHGMRIPKSIEQPWFGMIDDLRGVDNFRNWPRANLVSQYPSTDPDDPFVGAPLTIPLSIEETTVAPALQTGVADYWAIFGYNQTQPLNQDPTIDPDPGLPGYEEPYAPLGYTPFPSAIRVTMTLHDPEGRMEGGREFQFVIRLPKMVNQ